MIECARVALALREAFDHSGLRVPQDLRLQGDAGLRAAQHPHHLRGTRAVSQALAQLLERRHPDLVCPR